MPRKRNDACVNTCCLCFIFRLFHQKMESRDIWTSDLRPRLVFSGFPVYKGKFSIQTQPGAQPDLSVATKPGHVNCLSAPRGSVSSPHLSSPSYWFFSLLRQCLGISGGERNTMVCQAKKKWTVLRPKTLSLVKRLVQWQDAGSGKPAHRASWDIPPVFSLFCGGNAAIICSTWEVWDHPRQSV